MKFFSTKQTVTSSEFDVFLPRGGISKNNSIDSAVFLGGCGNGKRFFYNTSRFKERLYASPGKYR